MSCSRIARALGLVVGVAASSSDGLEQPGVGGRLRANGTAQAMRSVAKVAKFGGSGISGSLTLQVSHQRWGSAVQWTTSDISVPAQLVQTICGDLPDEPTFSYSINQKWGHWSQSHAEGEACDSSKTGGHWDPTAACSKASGNEACQECQTAPGDYQCSPETFSPKPDARGSNAYKFLNEEACELGDLAGMKGELEAVVPEDNETESIMIQALSSPGGLAQMSAPFGKVTTNSLRDRGIGINCDASGPPAAHATNCDCVKFNGKRDRSVGTLTVSGGIEDAAFYLGGRGLSQLGGRSVVVTCGSSFGDQAGQPLFCAKIQ